MKKRLICMALSAMLLTACAPATPARPADDDVMTIVCTTYPIYLLAKTVTEGAGGVEIARLDTGSTSCLHDYNLTVNDMKKLDRADVIAISGAGLEEFMEDALHTSDALVVDCSTGVELLENRTHHHEEGEEEDEHGHDDHDHGHFDPHYWMNPANLSVMARNLSDGLAGFNPDCAGRWESNCKDLEIFFRTLHHNLEKMAGEAQIPGLITFHDGFQYFAHAYGFPLLESIEEEAGSEASAREIIDITEVVREHNIPVIFTEVSGSDATANAIARETGCAVAQLSMLMSPVEGTIEDYRKGMLANMEAVLRGFGEEIE